MIEEDETDAAFSEFLQNSRKEVGRPPVEDLSQVRAASMIDQGLGQACAAAVLLDADDSHAGGTTGPSVTNEANDASAASGTTGPSVTNEANDASAASDFW